MAKQAARKRAPVVIPPARLAEAQVILRATCAALLAEAPDMAQDEALLRDMLDGEAGDALDIMRALLSSAVECRSYAAALAERQARILARRQELEARAQGMEQLVATTIRALELPTLDCLDGVLRLRSGTQRVVVQDLDALPDRYRRVEITPRLADLAAAYRAAGEDPAFVIPGACFERGPDTHSMSAK